MAYEEIDRLLTREAFRHVKVVMRIAQKHSAAFAAGRAAMLPVLNSQGRVVGEENYKRYI